ncbi:hypothetical protein N2152v2_004355 [Parachlorella kessleri]
MEGSHSRVDGDSDASIELDEEAVGKLEALLSGRQHAAAVPEAPTLQAAGPQGVAQCNPQEQQRPWWHTSLLGQLSKSQQQHGGPLAVAWGSLTGMLAKQGQARWPTAAVALPGSSNHGREGLPSITDDISVPVSEASQGGRKDQWQQLEAMKAEMALVRSRIREIDSLLERAASHHAGPQQP